MLLITELLFITDSECSEGCQKKQTTELDVEVRNEVNLLEKVIWTIEDRLDGFLNQE